MGFLFLVVIPQHVALQIAFLRRPIITQGALKGFLSGMYPSVSLQIFLVAKRPPTDQTRVFHFVRPRQLLDTFPCIMIHRNLLK
jgi:hypothetical protein